MSRVFMFSSAFFRSPSPDWAAQLISIKFRMGKITTNPKSIESRERKAENAAAKKAAILKAKEDASWEDNDKQLARKADRANAAVSRVFFDCDAISPMIRLKYLGRKARK